VNLYRAIFNTCAFSNAILYFFRNNSASKSQLFLVFATLPNPVWILLEPPQLMTSILITIGERILIMRKIIIGFISLLCIVAMVGCGGSGGGGGSNNGNGNNNGSSTTNSDLSALVLSAGKLTQDFASSVTSYTLSTGNRTIIVTPTAADTGASITVQGIAVTSGAASAPISLEVGSNNTVTIVVTSPDAKTTKTYTITVTREEFGIGDPCTCVNDGDNKCNNKDTGAPLPANGTISGCDKIPLIDITAGSALICLRSFDATEAHKNDLYKDVPFTYFAEGYCALGSAKCSSTLNLCSIDPGASFGKYEDMKTCPSGSVMISFRLSILGGIMTIDTSVCAKSCSSDSDCRKGEWDNVLNETSQYQCITKDTAKFCYDPRNLTSAYTATQF
jgi:hypothetical protein